MNKNKNSNDDKLKYLMYCRKSSEDSKERQAQSIESQFNELKDLAKRDGLKVVKVYTEEKSAHTTGREVFARMVEAIQRGEGDAILTWHANRLTRNMTDGAVIVSLMDSNILKEIKTTGRTYTSDSMDKFIIIMEFGLSKKDSDDKSIVVKRGLKTKCEKGSMPGLAPLGYLNTPHLPGGSRKIVKDSERFDIVKQIWDMMATGRYSVKELWKYLDNDLGLRTRKFKREGGKPLSLSSLYKIFRDPFYYGEFVYPRNSGNFYQGIHESMISKETFSEVQRIINRNTKTRSKTKVFDYTGVMRCGGCGAQITAEEKIKHQKNGNVHKYTYYRCTRRKDPNCKNPAIPLKDLEVQIKEKVEKIGISPVFEKWAIKYLKVLHKQELETKESLVSQNEGKQKRIEEEADRLFNLYVSPENEDKSILDYREFIDRKKKLKNEMETLRNGVANIESKLQKGLLRVKEDFNFAVYALRWLIKGTPGERKGVLSGLGYNHLLTNKILSITLKKPFQILSDNHNQITEETPKLEPLKNEAPQRETAVLTTAFLSVLRGLDSNQRSLGYEPNEITASPPRDIFLPRHLSIKLLIYKIFRLIFKLI